MDVQTVGAVIDKRAATDDEYDAEVERCWAELASALTEDLSWTMEYLENECTADEFSWISEVWDELVEKTQSVELVVLLRRLFERFPEDRERYHYDSNLDISIGNLNVDESMIDSLRSRR